MEKILIANRGEIARRIQRTCRDMGIATVAVFSEPDRDALFVAEADEAVALGGMTPAESYLRIEAILDAAMKTGADGIHPGYGFLAENAELARGCERLGIKLVGPTSEAIALMGSKIEAKRRMQEAGVPVLPSIEVAGSDDGALLKKVEQLGWPVLIKASAGGGGRGMRIVRESGDLSAALDSARREAKSAFGDDTVFIEPYVESPRHVEIQIFGDTHGEVIHLFERDCSIQRRHQKILEESPSPAVDDELRAAMGEAAVKAGKSIGYVNAGTVEFLLAPDGNFYFLEVNTRLQVEHPVTECVTGLDLVRLQILIARGEPLPDEARSAAINGHAIEVRLYAEDPQRDFMPTSGMLHRFRIPPAAGIRVDSGVGDGTLVTPYYDPLLAKVIVHAPTREEAARQLAAALAKAQIHGPRTNRDLLVRVLRHADFLAGRTDTHFFDRHAPAELGRSLADADATRWQAVAAALAAQAQRRATTSVLPNVPSGWRNNPSTLQQAQFTTDDGQIDVGYRFDRKRLVLEVNGEPAEDVRVGRCTAEHVQLEIAGVLRGYDVHQVDGTYYVDSSWGATELKVVERFPPPEALLAAGSLVAPLPGVVDSVKVKVGDVVAAGDVLLVIESMKMMHHVSAPVAGRVAELRVEATHHVEAGALLAVIEEDAAS